MSDNLLDITLEEVERVVDPDEAEFVLYAQGDPDAIVFELKNGNFYVVKAGDSRQEVRTYAAAAELALDWRLENHAG